MVEVLSDGEASEIVAELEAETSEKNGTTNVRLDNALLLLIDGRRKTIAGVNGKRSRKQSRGEVVSTFVRLGYKYCLQGKK